MSLGVRTCRGFIFGPSDMKDEQGRGLYGISDLKKPDQPPLLYNQKECIAYVYANTKRDPNRRVDPYGMVHKRKVNMYNTKEECIVTGEEHSFYL